MKTALQSTSTFGHVLALITQLSLREKWVLSKHLEKEYLDTQRFRAQGSAGDAG